MTESASHISTLRERVAHQFASRPTLRQVLATGVYQAMLRRYPDLATALPETSTAEGFTVALPAGKSGIKLESLIDLLLEAFRTGAPVAFKADHHLSLQPVAGATDDVTEEGPLARLRIDLASLNTELGQQLENLLEQFQRAQADFWNARDTEAPDERGVIRHRWMAQTLRMAMLGDESLARLDDDERTCLFELLAGGSQRPEVQVLEVQISADGRAVKGVLSDLLVSAEKDERQVVLWCRAGGAVQAFPTLQDFGLALKDSLGEHYQFDTLSWNRYPLTGDVFLRQSALVLSEMLGDVRRLSLQGLQDVAHLEQAFAHLSAPSRFFLSAAPEQRSPDWLPDWLAAADAADRFEYHAALLDLAVHQAMAKGRTSLDGIDDLHGYAARRLREQLLADYPDEANYFPDDLILTVSVPDPLQDKELPVTLVEHGSVSLTELAIGHLDALQGGVVSAITHRTGQLIMDWMNPTYITRLIEQVNIGGAYPQYLTAHLDDPLQQPSRLACFAREWRIRLQFDALRAKILGQLDADTWQGVVEFCRAADEVTDNVEVAPLALKLVDGRGPSSEVGGMYVITLKYPARVLLYRPLLEHDPLSQYHDQLQLLAALDQAGELQGSVLKWLQPDANYIGSDGGRLKGHPDWLAESSADPYLLPNLSVAVVLDIVPWTSALSTHLFAGKRQLMLDLADRQSVSNAEHRWAVIRQFSWLLFNLSAPLLPGPVALVGWLATALASTVDDVKALLGDDKGEKSLAVVNLINSFSLLLMHQRPGTELQAEAAAPAYTYRSPPARRPYLAVAATASMGPLQGGQALAARPGRISLGQGWPLAPDAQRKALMPLARQVELAAATPANGLERLDGKFYVRLYGQTFEVTHVGDERFLMTPDGKPGPCLRNVGGQWKVMTGFAFGGAPKPVGSASLQRRFDAGDANLGNLIEQVNSLNADAVPFAAVQASCEADLSKLQTSREKAVANPAFSQEQLGKLIEHYDLKIQAKHVELAQATAVYVEKLDEIIATEQAILSQASELQELYKSRRVVVVGDVTVFEKSIKEARCGLLRSNWLISPRLYRTVDYEGLHKARTALSGQPMLQVIDAYRDYKAKLRTAVQQQRRLIMASAMIDEQLRALPLEEEIFQAEDSPVGGQPAMTVKDLIEQRHLSTLDLQFQQLRYYFDLALNADIADPNGKLARYHAALTSQRLTTAANNHAELLNTNLSAAEQLYILQTAWNEYSKAIISSIDIAREGGALIDAPSLASYKEQLEHLKKSVNELIVPVVAQMDGAANTQRKVYHTTDNVHRIAQTRYGQDVIGVEVQRDGQRLLEVRNAFDQELLAGFVWENEQWVQSFPVEPVVAQPLPGNALEGSARRASATTAEALLKMVVRKQINDGEAFSQIAALIDTHVRKLQAVVTEVPDDGSDIARALSEALAQWPAKRTELLTAACVSTRYPDAAALRFMHEQHLLRVTSARARFTTRDGTATDEYKIELLQSPAAKRSEARWYAHFHFASQADFATAFTSGHLKTETQRYFGAEDARRLAERGERIHRGKLTLAQAQGIIPFH